MRTDVGGLRCGPGVPVGTWSDAHCSWPAVVPTRFWTRAPIAAVLMSSSRAAANVSHFLSPAGRSCSLHRSGTSICRKSALCFPPLRGLQRRTKRCDASRPDGAAPRTTSMLPLSAKVKSATLTCSLFFQTIVNGFITQRTKLFFECVVREKFSKTPDVD